MVAHKLYPHVLLTRYTTNYVCTSMYVRMYVCTSNTLFCQRVVATVVTVTVAVAVAVVLPLLTDISFIPRISFVFPSHDFPSLLSSVCARNNYHKNSKTYSATAAFLDWLGIICLPGTYYYYLHGM